MQMKEMHYQCCETLNAIKSMLQEECTVADLIQWSRLKHTNTREIILPIWLTHVVNVLFGEAFGALS